MQAFTIDELMHQQRESGQAYMEFLRHSSMSIGVYTLAAGTADKQQPHTEDEVYYVVQGQAHIRVGAEDRAVSAGSIVFVAAHVVHYFHTITDDLTVLVFFAPAEYTLRSS